MCKFSILLMAFQQPRTLMSIYQRKKIYVYLIEPQLLLKEERPKYITKVGTMTNPTMGYYQLTRTYNDEAAMMIKNSDIMLLDRYH